MLGDRIIRENTLWATGGGLIPVPMLDMIAITAVELKMLKELSALYEVPFREHQVKSILALLLAGMGAPVLGAAITASLFKFVPILGAVAGSSPYPVRRLRLLMRLVRCLCSTSPPAERCWISIREKSGNISLANSKKENWLLEDESRGKPKG